MTSRQHESAGERLALDGGAPARRAPYPREEPPPPAKDADPLAAFERELGAFAGGRVAVACRGRTEALVLALRVATSGHDPAAIELAAPTLGGNEIARAALDLGITVLPVDVEHDSGNLAARNLAAAVGGRTRALAVTHRFGHPATMPDLLRLAQHHGLALLEDVSEALGAAYAGVPAGAFGIAAALGGGAGHLLTPVDVGAVLVEDDAAAGRVRAWRDAASGPPPEGAVRVALAELRAAEESLHARRQAAWHLTYELRHIRGVSAMYHGRRVRHAYDRYVLRLRSVLWDRGIEETVAALAAEGVPAEVAAGPLLHEDVDVRARLVDDPRLAPDRFHVADQLARELVALPLNAAVTTSDMNDVAAAVRRVAQAGERHDASEGAR